VQEPKTNWNGWSLKYDKGSGHESKLERQPERPIIINFVGHSKKISSREDGHKLHLKEITVEVRGTTVTTVAQEIDEEHNDKQW
jgi:hypothetical protein